MRKHSTNIQSSHVEWRLYQDEFHEVVFPALSQHGSFQLIATVIGAVALSHSPSSVAVVQSEWDAHSHLVRLANYRCCQIY